LWRILEAFGEQLDPGSINRLLIRKCEHSGVAFSGIEAAAGVVPPTTGVSIRKRNRSVVIVQKGRLTGDRLQSRFMAIYLDSDAPMAYR
jgi:hypothetical protein